MTASSPVRPRAGRKPPAERGEELRAAAREIARRDGLVAVTLRSVAERVGVTRTLVVHYEPNMEALVAATFRTIAEDELAEMRAETDAEATATDALRVLTRALLDTGRDEVTAMWAEVFVLSRRNDALQGAVRDLMDQWQEFVVSLIERGMRAGEFHTDDAHSVAWQYLGMIDGINSHALVNYGAAMERGRLVCHAMEHELGLAPGSLR
ncbi:MAG TPA: TetR family transcriptional regulator C-terminal domain-containing protein [Microbacterium sp.]|uniref:TetR/AcrR family transcriptional regulator n=1 Tax=Microbacterium sp. TaxID=51671 RepID=UPI002B45C230|nr:TetR family transcriptional regulator C-terminal domain-containing protein [Microbacterium sp.]HKT56217.1 TetR family transcriptional regulator C-terminal domain-containing protein [Microbacterium sp.]